MYKNYIFDLDGTLLNTLADLASSTNYALRQYGMPEHSVDDVRRFVGNGVGKLIERAIPDGLANPLYEDVLATFRKHYLIHSLDTTSPYPGIGELLHTLRSMGCNVAVVSNKFYNATVELCQHFFADTVFEAMRQLGVTAEDTVYVGDSDVDVATARNSGIPCISVLWGFRDRDFLIEHGATTFVNTPEEILNKC